MTGFSQAESIAEIIRLEPQLILLDERLPENPGHILCASIKEHPVAQSIPVVLISAVVNLENIAAGCKEDSFIKKPFDLKDLIGLVNSYLQ